jgi:hypothetical protein
LEGALKFRPEALVWARRLTMVTMVMPVRALKLLGRGW